MAQKNGMDQLVWKKESIKCHRGNMSKLVITTVGTSILSKSDILCPSGYTNDIKELIEGKPLRENIRGHFTDESVKKIIESFRNERPNKYLSAEIASLKAFKYNKELGFSNEDIIALFSTDTEDGKFCAEVNKKVLDKLGWCNVLGPIVITGLKTKKTKEAENISQSFKDAGLNTLKKEVENLLSSQNYPHKYFNITGGFKAVIPFATVLAIEKGMSLMYLYEESDDLIVIKLPSIIKRSFDEMKNGISLYCVPPGGY